MAETVSGSKRISYDGCVLFSDVCQGYPLVVIAIGTLARRVAKRVLETSARRAEMFVFDLLIAVWYLGPLPFGLYARTNQARAIMPRIVGWYYKYVIWHGIFFAMVGLSNNRTPLAISVIVVGAICVWFWLFDYFDPDRPDYVPPGVRLWATLWPGVARDREHGLVDTDRLEQRIRDSWPKPGSAAKAKAAAYKAKVDAYKMAAAKEYADAQAELARAARNYNEAKLRAEEAKRRSRKVER